MKKIQKLLAITIGFILILSFTNCQKEEIPLNLEGKTYVLPLVESKAECDRLFDKGQYNCAQYIYLKSNNIIEIILTDISSSGIYTLEENNLTLTIDTLAADPAAEPVYHFKMSDDQSTITRTVSGQNEIWKLQREGVDPWDL
jgi:hypothetical protein